MTKDDFAFFHALRVRWAEVDMQGIVFNGHYLNYFDVAFTEYWRATGLPGALLQAKEGKEMFARKATIDYLAPARFDDILEIGVRCTNLGTTSLRFTLGIFRYDELLITGELIYVVAEGAVRKSVPLPAFWRSTITAFEKLMPAQ